MTILFKIIQFLIFFALNENETSKTNKISYIIKKEVR